ncbi:MAG: hypothetical protein WC721_00975 [Victivallaceae bacterium]
MGERLPVTAISRNSQSSHKHPDYEKRVVLNDTPKCRSRTVVRPAMPAA